MTGSKAQTMQRGQHIFQMKSGTAYNEGHNQIADIVNRNICTEKGLDLLKSRWRVEYKKAKILLDFQIWTDGQILVNKPEIIIALKDQKTKVVQNDSNIRKTEKLEKYHGLMLILENKVIPGVVGTLGAMTPKVGE